MLATSIDSSKRYEAANTSLVDDNRGPWLSITAEKDPQSIFGVDRRPGRGRRTTGSAWAT